MDGGEKKEVRRPMNAFLIFCKRHRGFVREKNPDMDNRSVTRVLGDLWANLGEEKKVYTNLAKQYKDAFMKANPNYKWHSADKTQSSSAKMVNKPTNSRVIKSVAEIHTDGSITPGKLADPEKMGGLNLLLMADKEMCTPLASTRIMSLSQPGLSAQPSPADQSTVSASALLQLAEMCTSELEGCNENQPRPSSQTLPASAASIPLSNVPYLSQQPMPPPKKRVRHWSLTEADGVYDASSDSNREYMSGSLSPQNTCTLKTRCTSLGSALSPADRYSTVSTYRPYPARRKLSSSATESIPSPTGPLEDGMDDTDSPVFSPDANRHEHLSGESRLDNHDHSDYLPQNLSRSRSPTLVSKSSVHVPSSDQKDQPVSQKVLKPATPNHVTVSLQQPLNILTGTSGSVLSAFPDHPMPNTSRHGMLLSLYSVPASKTYGNQEVDAKSENGSDNFSTWREVDKRRTKSEELLPGALNLHMSSSYTHETCPPSRQSHLHEKHGKYRMPYHNLTGFEPKCNSQTNSAASSALPVDLSFVTSACSVAKQSMLGKGRIASILNNSSASSEVFHLDTSNYHSALETLSKMNSEVKKCVKNSAHKNEQVSEQSTSLPVLTSVGTNNSIIHIQPGFKILETQGANISINNPQTFREVKLKKKWTERMLIETKLQGLTQQVEHSGGHSLSNETFHVGSHSDTGAGAYVLPLECKPDKYQLKNFSDVAISGSSNNETTVLKMPSAYDIPSLQALLILNQPAGLADKVPNHTHVPFCSSNTSHTKLMLQLAQNQQTDRQCETKSNQITDRQYETKSKNFCEEPAFKSEPSGIDLTGPHHDCKYVNLNHHQQPIHRREDNYVHTRQEESICKESNIKSRKVDGASKDSEVKCEFNKKQVLNQITACGQKVMDRIVEQLCKSDYSGGGDSAKVEFSVHDDCQGNSASVEDVEPNTGEVAALRGGLRGGPPGAWLKKEEQKDCSLLEEPCSVGKVGNVVSSSKAQLDHALEDDSSHSRSASTNLLSKHEVLEDNFQKRESCGQTAASVSAETHVQNQWSAVAPESYEHSDLNEDSSMQPVRKSRRANRGQKYQELIKEGFIQPSRERMAARNAERGGRSFGTREEFEKMELKRTLKRSASEKDMPSDGLVVFSSSVAGSAVAESTVDRRFTSGDFDLEKEIESLPVCSLDQMDRKKAVKRRCEGDSLGLTSSHRNNGDAVSTLLRTPTSTSHSKLGPFGGSQSKFDDLSEPCCLAPHIPLPKEERPTEPVTGSRKRKARKHCIMRISVVDEKTPLAEMAVKKNATSLPSEGPEMAVQKCAKTLPSECPEEQLCNLPRETQCYSVNNCGSVNSCADSSSTGLASSLPLECKAETDVDGTSMNILAEDWAATRNDNAFTCPVSLSQTVNAKGKMVSPTSVRDVRNLGDNFASLPSSSSSSPSSAYKTLSESQLNSATTSGQKMSKLFLPRSTSALCSQTGTIAASLEIPSSSSSLEMLASSATIEAASSLTSLTRVPAMLRLSDCSVVDTSSQAKCSSSDGNCLLLARTALPKAPHKQVGKFAGFKSVLSGKQLPKSKGVEKNSRKTSGGKMKLKPHGDEKLQVDVRKAKSPVKRKFTEDNERNVYVKSSSTPLVSALLGHIDLSYAIHCAERGENKVVSIPQLWADYKTSEPAGENSSVNPTVDSASLRSAETKRLDLLTPAVSIGANPLSTLKTHLIPFNVVEGLDKKFVSSAVTKGMKEPVMFSLNSVLKSAASVSASSTTSTLSLEEEPSSNERSSLAAIKDASLLHHKPHPSMLSVIPTDDTATAKPPPSVSPDADSGSSTSLLQHRPVCLVTAAGSPTNHVYISRTSTPSSSTSSAMHNSFLSQMSSSSSMTQSDNPVIPSSTLPLFPLTQPTSPPPGSSAALSSSSSTVISLATSIPSTKNDIVSYTVIGSASVMESGSPHMIGSPHLPESPSVAIVQS